MHWMGIKSVWSILFYFLRLGLFESRFSSDLIPKVEPLDLHYMIYELPSLINYCAAIHTSIETSKVLNPLMLTGAWQFWKEKCYSGQFFVNNSPTNILLEYSYSTIIINGIIDPETNLLRTL